VRCFGSIEQTVAAGSQAPFISFQLPHIFSPSWGATHLFSRLTVWPSFLQVMPYLGSFQAKWSKNTKIADFLVLLLRITK
jgi:hypothetical protein